MTSDVQPTDSRGDPFELDPQRVAASFGAASRTYDAAAMLQRDVRGQLLERLDELRLFPEAVLDLGAGTGEGARDLKQRFPNARVVAVDISVSMLQAAKKQLRLLRKFDRVAGNAYRLPFQDDSFDVVFSNLMFQWCNDLSAAMREVQRVLTPGGRLLFSTFGPDTLVELRLAWAQADPESSRVNRFLDMHDVGSALQQAALAEPVLDVDRIVRTYSDVQSLMRELKAIGAHNVTAGRPRGLTGPKRFTNMLQAYERFRRDGLLPATYEVVFASAWGSDHSPANARVDGEILISPSAIKRRG
jgi:malonyl-CoA O-methyltransferase